LSADETHAASTATFRLSPQQERLFAAGAAAAAEPIQCAVVLEGVDADGIREGVAAVVERNEALRTTFERLPAMRLPAQAVHDRLDPRWRDAPAGESEASLLALLESETAEPFDLARGPVLRVCTAPGGDDRLLLVLTAPAAVADARSLLLVAQAVAAAARGEDAPAEEPLQYADYAAWRHESGTGGDDDVAPILGALAPAQPFGRQSAAGGDGVSTIPVASGLAGRLQAAAASVGADLETILQAAWLGVLCRVGGVEDVSSSVRAAGRGHAELVDALGAYEQPLPLTVHVEPETTFAEVIDQVRRTRAEAERAAEVAPAQTLGAADTLDTSVAVVVVDDLEVRALRTGRLGAAVSVVWTVGASELEAWIDHGTASLSPDAAARLARTIGVFVDAIPDGVTTPLVSLPILSEQDERELAVLEAGETVDIPPVCLHELVERTADRVPDATAITSTDGDLTYRELDEQANRLAHRLADVGVGAGDAVGICMRRSAGSIVAVLATMKAGAAYVPLNFEHPAARLANQLEQAGAKAVVTEASVADRLPESGLPVIILDRDAELAAASPARPAVDVSPDHLAYVLYTSGSTGKPKGVEITHRNLVNYTTHLLRVLGDVDGRTFGVVSALSTDLGNTSLFPSLAGGGCLVLVDPDTAMDPALFAERQRERPIDILKITPSHLRALIAGDDDVLPRHCLVLGGEALSWDLLDRVSVGGLRVLNHYGPTETTIGSCIFDPADGSARSAATVPVGRPIANTRVHVLDSKLARVPLGTPGELCIAGAGVGRGYVGAPGLTEAAFVASPFADDGRMYRTGDRVRMLERGAIEFLGRVDHQVKIRGFRVEPGEIEAVLADHPQVKQAAVVARGEADDRRLFAYVVPSGSPTHADLRAHLATLLPEYMIPSAFVTLESLPLTPSGKVDRLALPDPETSPEQAYVAPRNDVESTIADAFASALGVDRVGVDDNFFSLGGHSLMATQVVARLRTTFAVDLPLHALFTAPTVAGLAATVSELGGGLDGDVAAIMAELDGLSEEEVGALLADEEDA
jgi:amino acid adenylation domain-containing protein